MDVRYDISFQFL